MAAPDIFISAIADGSKITDNKLGKWVQMQDGLEPDEAEKFTKRWKWFMSKDGPTAGTQPDLPCTAKFFAVKTYSDNESQMIDTALQNPSTFRIDSYGNIMFADGTKIINPTVSAPHNDITKEGAPVLSSFVDKGGTLPNSYRFSKTLVPTQQMLYFLKRGTAQNRNQWVLLYNPIHRAAFKEMFKKALAAESPPPPWGLPTQGPFSIAGMMRQYCGALQIDSSYDETDGDTHVYADPTCTTVMGGDACVMGSLFGNELEQDQKTIDTILNAPGKPGATAIKNTLLARSSDTGPVTCACFGAAYNWYSQMGFTSAKGNSYMSEFAPNFASSLSSCSADLTLNFCTTKLDADSIVVKGSSIESVCGSSIPQDTPTPTPGGGTPTPTPGGGTPTPTPGGDTPTPTPGGGTPTPTPGGGTPTPTPGGGTPTPTPGTPSPGGPPKDLQKYFMYGGIVLGGLIFLMILAKLFKKKKKKE